MVLLSFERGSSAIGQYTEFRKQWDKIADIAAQVDRDGRPAAEDPVLRQEMAKQLVELECLKYHSWHILTQTSRGKDLGFEASMTKLQWSETFTKEWTAYTDVVGAYYQAPELNPGVSLTSPTTMSMWARSCTIWGGSSQVQRTIVAERVLGLPR